MSRRDVGQREREWNICAHSHSAHLFSIWCMSGIVLGFGNTEQRLSYSGFTFIGGMLLICGVCVVSV